MTSKILLEVLKKTVAVCKKLKLRIAFMGGIAAGVYGQPRTTYDVDALVLVEEKDLQRLLGLFSREGFSYDKKEPVKRIHGLRFITLVYPKLKTYVDLFIAGSNFHRGMLERAHSVRLASFEIPLISPEDLVLLKLLSGRDKDTEDVREILMANKKELDMAYLEKQARELEVDLFLKDEMESLNLAKKPKKVRQRN
jgi:hypothetical protein